MQPRFVLTVTVGRAVVSVKILKWTERGIFYLLLDSPQVGHDHAITDCNAKHHGRSGGACEPSQHSMVPCSVQP